MKSLHVGLVGMKKTYFSIILLLSATGCFAEEPKISPEQYWSDFRQAVIAADYQKLRGYTQFPLAVHGIVDGIPVQNIGSDQFEVVMKKVLAQPVASYEGDKVVTYTQRELISKTKNLRNVKIEPDKSFSVGELDFEKKGNTTKLVRVYLSE